MLFPNGQHRDYTYDDQGRLLQLANLDPSAGNLATYAYGYDLDNATGQFMMRGQRTSMTADVPAQGFAGAFTKYYYDRNYQLTGADYPNVAPFHSEIDRWGYDAIGNRLASNVNGQTQSYTYQRIGTNPNNWQRLLSDGVNDYAYDANGSTTSKGNETLGWDYENRMTSLTGVAAAASYSYDFRPHQAAIGLSYAQEMWGRMGSLAWSDQSRTR